MPETVAGRWRRRLGRLVAAPRRFAWPTTLTEESLTGRGLARGVRTVALRPLRCSDEIAWRRLRLADDARLARRSLEAMRSLLDDAPWRPVYNQVPDCALALWDDTTADERERMAILPDAVLGLHALAAVSLRPRPGERVRRRVARAVSTVVPGARPSLVTDLLDAFWDLTTDPVPENQAGINEAAAAALREAAAQHALRFRPLAEEIARASRGDMGSDADGVRRFLIQTWATTAPSPRPQPLPKPTMTRRTP
mgnify:CR=1 FL=1